MPQAFDTRENAQAWQKYQEKLRAAYTQDSGNFLKHTSLNDQTDLKALGNNLIDMSRHEVKKDASSESLHNELEGQSSSCADSYDTS